MGRKLLIDYKLYCINGAVWRAQVMSGKKEYSLFFNVNMMDLDWASHPEYSSSHHPQGEHIDKLVSLDRMVEMATKLVGKLPFVCIDFYEVDANSVFGEMTFTPGFKQPQ